MLYSIYEANQALLAPLRLWSSATKAITNHPFAPPHLSAVGKALWAGADVLDDALRKREKPDWQISTTEIDGAAIPVKISAILEKPFGDLVHFQRAAKRDDPKVLLVAPMSGHYATLLRGTVEALLPNHDVYITDWHDAQSVPLSDGRFGVEDYIAYLLEFMRELGPDLNVIAVCQPAPLTLAAVSLLAAWDDPAQPTTMTLMGGPVDTEAAPTAVTELADKRSKYWFENHCITTVPKNYQGAGRRVYPGFLQVGAFIAMNPDRHFNAHMGMFRHLVVGDGDSADAHRKFYDEYLSVMDIPADFFVETVQAVFQNRDLPNGTMTWRGERVDPSLVKKTALLTVEGELDDISAPGQTIAAHDMCSGIPKNRHRNHLQPNVGHYGIFNGRRWRQEICPEIGRFIREMR